MSVEGRGVQSIEVGGRLLRALLEGGGPMMLRDLASRAEVAPAQAHAYLVSYRKQGLVEQDSNAGKYRLGPFALELGIARMRSFDPLRMAVDAVVGFSQDLGFSVAVSVWGTLGPTVVQVQESADQIYTNTRAGNVYSLTGTATGRVFAAFMPPSAVQELAAIEGAEGTRNRRVGRPYPLHSLKRELVAIRKRGFATIDSPPVPGVRALSSPVFDHVGQIQMAITVIGPEKALDTSDDSPVAVRLVSFAKHLSAQLGFEVIVPAVEAVDHGFQSPRTPQQRRKGPARSSGSPRHSAN